MNISFTGSWKTTLASVVTALSGFILFSSTAHMIEWPKWALAFASFAATGGLVAFGITAKDSNVTGGNVSNNLTVDSKEPPKP